MWAESLVFGENTATNNMLANTYNRTTRAHNLTLETLWLIMWPHFRVWAEGQDLYDRDLQKLSEHLAQSFNGKDGQDSPLMKQLEDKVQTGHLFLLLEQYDETLPPTSLYWRHYMKMVLVLLHFIRAERTGDWQKHKSAFPTILP